jgi:hypothetical protein
VMDGKRARLHINGRQTSHVVAGIERKPKRVAVDPNGWWLLNAKSVSGN